MSVPVIAGTYSVNETAAYTYFTNVMQLNKAAACAVLANIYHESRFNHRAIGDGNTSYGICQWHNERWTRLRNYCSTNGLNATEITGQLRYLQYELEHYYSSVLGILKSTPNTSDGCWEAAAQFCARFEVPAGYGYWNGSVLTLGPTSRTRGDFARSTYWTAYSGSSASTTTTTVQNKGSLILQEARKHLGRPYVWGGSSPSQSFDCSGFIYYVYKTAINYNWSRTTAYGQWKNYGRSVPSDSLMAGDLVFFKDTYAAGVSPNISHVGIATGNGTEFIHTSDSNGVSYATLENSYYKSHYYESKRLISDSETSFGSGSGSSSVSTGNDEVSLSSSYIRTYNEEVLEALEYIESQNAANMKQGNNTLGYLIDLVNGGEFRFYVPEYESGTRPTWDTQNILGRSSEIKGYNSTESKSIPLSLTLVAGEGLYKKSRGSNGDRISDLLDDVAFVESLGYPDYSKSFVLPPPVVLLYLGPHLKLKGVVQDISANYMKPFDSNMRPMRVELGFTVVHVTENPPDFYDIRNHRLEGSYKSSVNS